jgi:hypothetical protein
MGGCILTRTRGGDADADVYPFVGMCVKNEYMHYEVKG